MAVDIFKQNRYLNLIIILLVLLNVATLTMVWLGRPQRSVPPPQPVRPEREEERLQQLLKNELGFNEDQIRQYMSIREGHQRDIRRLNDEIRQIKKQMFDEVLGDNPKPQLSDSLLALTQEKQAEIERLTFQYFLDLKKLCKPEQQNKLKLLIDEIFRGQPERGGQGAAPPQPGAPPERDDRTPPPRRDGQPQPPPRQ